MFPIWNFVVVETNGESAIRCRTTENQRGFLNIAYFFERWQRFNDDDDSMIRRRRRYEHVNEMLQLSPTPTTKDRNCSVKYKLVFFSWFGFFVSPSIADRVDSNRARRSRTRCRSSIKRKHFHSSFLFFMLFCRFKVYDDVRAMYGGRRTSLSTS